MATHSSILAWRIPWTEKPGRLQSMQLQSQTHLVIYLGHYRDFFFPFHLSCRIYSTKSSVSLHPLNVCGTYSSVPSLITDSTGNSCSFSKFLNQFRVGFPKFSAIYISVQISLCWGRQFYAS